MKFVSFNDFPRVIEPVCNVIETTAAMRSGLPTAVPPEEHRHTVLRRVALPAIRAEIPELPNDTVHLFGNAKDGGLPGCNVLLGYDFGGQMRHMLLRGSDQRWVVHEIPEEANGRFVEQPSCRVVFSDAESFSAFVAWLNELRSSGRQNKELLDEAVKGIVCVRTTAVWHDRAGDIGD